VTSADIDALGAGGLSSTVGLLRGGFYLTLSGADTVQAGAALCALALLCRYGPCGQLLPHTRAGIETANLHRE
jgi:hypothetical protein